MITNVYVLILKDDDSEYITEVFLSYAEADRIGKGIIKNYPIFYNDYYIKECRFNNK